jgi:hypothetical protein
MWYYYSNDSGDDLMESRFGLRNKASVNHWQPCDIKELKVTKPMIICLSGNATRTELDANGFCKLVENLLGDKSQEVDLFGVAYGYYDRRVKLSSEEVELLVDNILMPLCKDKKTGDLLSVEECCKNLSLITFFTFCYGNFEASKIVIKFNEKLKGQGLSKEDRSTLTKSLFEINYAKETDIILCPQIVIASAQDQIGNIFSFQFFCDYDYDEKFKDHYAIVYDEPGQFCKKCWDNTELRRYESITVIANSILKGKSDRDSFSLQSEDHNIRYFEKDENGFNPQLNEEGKALRSAMQISLQKRIENSILNQNSKSYTQFNLQELNSFLENNLPKENRISSPVEKDFV